MSTLGWTVILRHTNGLEMEIPVDDLTVAYEASLVVRGLCSWLYPVKSRISIAGAVADARHDKGGNGHSSTVQAQPTGLPGQ